MKNRWQDWGNILAGFWLILSPQQLGFSLDHYASGNSCGIGTLLVVYNLMIAGRIVDEGQEFLNLIFGIWLMLSPYALGFTDARNAALNTMAIGLATTLLAGWSIYRALARRK